LEALAAAVIIEAGLVKSSASLLPTNRNQTERTTGEDRAGRPQPLFNPRAYDPWLLGWHLHFVLDRESGMILPRSAVGEATVAALNMNGRHRRFTRLLQIRAGLIG
jgi:hypothetical protein